MLCGLTQVQIAERLVISKRTVERHHAIIFLKIDSASEGGAADDRNRDTRSRVVDLVAYALRERPDLLAGTALDDAARVYASRFVSDAVQPA
jgi:DNA-binding NarL/FixJ family response regulator